jgi:hypothetical protein
MVEDQTFHDLGKNVDVAVVAWRPKAIEMGAQVISVHDPSHEEFKRIQDRANNEQNSGCMYGPEFLVWIPSAGKCATYFMGSKSARRESPKIKALMRQAATIGSQHIETKKYDWYAPKITECSTPLQAPPVDALEAAVEMFNNPPAPEFTTEAEETRAR